jgi:hypothetical protein
VDSRGLGRSPEKRKVGSSTLPLTTRSDQAILPVYLRQRYFGPHLLAARRCPSKTSHDRLWRFTAARGLHGPEVAVWMQTIGAQASLLSSHPSLHTAC